VAASVQIRDIFMEFLAAGRSRQRFVAEKPLSTHRTPTLMRGTACGQEAKKRKTT